MKEVFKKVGLTMLWTAGLPIWLIWSLGYRVYYAVKEKDLDYLLVCPGVVFRVYYSIWKSESIDEPRNLSNSSGCLKECGTCGE